MSKQMKVDLTSYDVDELKAITENAKKLIIEKQQQRLLDAYQQFEDIATKCHSSIDEILQAGEQLEKERSIKYRNPKNPEETWIGRGRKPTWLVEAIDSGKNLEDFAV